METCLFLSAPIIYVVIILFSGWMALRPRVDGRSRDVGALAAFAAGWVACAFAAILVLLGQLQIPSIPTTLWVISLSGGIGFLVGFGYLGLANLVLGRTKMTNLFILGSVGGSSISFFFYVFYKAVQVAFISSAVAFLFGALLYVVVSGGRATGGLQDLMRRSRYRR